MGLHPYIDSCFEYLIFHPQNMLYSTTLLLAFGSVAVWAAEKSMLRDLADASLPSVGSPSMPMGRTRSGTGHRSLHADDSGDSSSFDRLGYERAIRAMDAIDGIVPPDTRSETFRERYQLFILWSVLFVALGLEFALLCHFFSEKKPVSLQSQIVELQGIQIDTLAALSEAERKTASFRPVYLYTDPFQQAQEASCGTADPDVVRNFFVDECRKSACPSARSSLASLPVTVTVRPRPQL